MLIIHPPEIENLNDDSVKLKTIFEVNNIKKEMWYSTTPEFGQYFCQERGDAFIIPLLFYAMKRNLPVKMEVPISERLYYTITNYLTKAMVYVFKEWHEVSLNCPVISEPLDNAGAVGTGLSCGIDSFCTVIDHLSERQPKGYRLTHCTFFDVGGHSPLWTDSEKTKKLFRQRVERVRQCAEALGLPLVLVDSNMEEILERPFSATSTFAIASAVLALQKLFKTYYLSSGARFDELNFSRVCSGDYDLFTLPMVSTDSLKLFLSGVSYSRVEKTSMVAAFSLSYTYLDVCLFRNENCSMCEKCLRTLLTLDVLGKAHLYKNIFDLDLYRKNRSWYIGYMMVTMHRKGALRAVYQTMVEKGQLGFVSRIFYYLAWYRHRVVIKIKRMLGNDNPSSFF